MYIYLVNVGIHIQAPFVVVHTCIHSRLAVDALLCSTELVYLILTIGSRDLFTQGMGWDSLKQMIFGAYFNTKWRVHNVY